MNKPKLDLAVNIPATIKLLMDKPVTGSNAYGNWYLFGVEYEGQEYSFFATEDVAKYAEENNLRKGDEIKVTKTLVKNGKRNTTTYQIETIKKSNTETNVKVNGNGHSHIGDYDLMYESLAQAKQLQSEFGALVDFSKVAISLFISKKKNGNSLHY